jgi:hypothetical protein
MRVRRIQQQDGGTLVIVLVFIAVFGLIISGLMTESSANVKFTTAVSAREEKVYAADAGVSYGIQQLRQDTAHCPRVGTPGPTIPDLTINNRTVKVECSVNSGSTGGIDGYAVVTMSPNAGSLVLSNSSAKKISGDVYVSGGVDWGPGLTVKRGDFVQQKHGASCLNPPGPGDLTVESPPYSVLCKLTTEYPVPDPERVAPAVPTVTNPAYSDHGTCRVFSPGIYTSPPTLRSGDNYFISGVYYFLLNDSNDNNNVIEVKQATIYGGQPTTAELAEQRFPLPTDCSGQDPANSGTGVEFIFGAKARMFINTQGQVELFGRRTANAASTETRNISFVAVPNNDSPNWPTTAGNWTASTLASGTPVLDIKDGNQQDLAIHGVVYAPTQGVGLTATNSVLAQTMSGLVAYTLELKSSASAQGLAVSVAPGTPSPRLVLVTATVTESGARDVQSRAVVQIENDDSRSVTLKSWRTLGPTDPL